MLKVTKFGGTSMADAGQYRKVREIIQSDSSRRVVVVSAAGKRDRNDHKITDLLYLCHAHTLYGVECDRIFEMITSRYLQIRNDLGIQLDLEAEFAALKQRIDTKTLTQDELVSRGEYFSARLMAAYLGFQFVDAAEWVRFRFDGSVDQEASYEALRQQIRGSGVVTPGFYGRMPDGRIRLLARGGTCITGKKDFSIISMSKWGMSNQVGVLRKMLSVLERHGISINYAPNGIDNVSVVMPSEALAPHLYTVLAEIQNEVSPDSLDVHDQIAVVAAVGRKMAFRPGVSGKIFAALGEAGISIRMINQGPDELNIIFGVANRDFADAIRVLYNSFVK